MGTLRYRKTGGDALARALAAIDRMRSERFLGHWDERFSRLDAMVQRARRRREASR